MMAKPLGPMGLRAAPAGCTPLAKTDRIRNGRRVSIQRIKPDDPRMATLEARCRQYGVAVDKANRLRMRAPYMCCDLGMVIARFHPDHAAATRLWNAWQAFCGAKRTYRIRILARSGDPVGTSAGWVATSLSVELADVDLVLGTDTRTEEQKVEGARAANAYWEGLLERADPGIRYALTAAERGDGPPLWREGQPTRMGTDTLRAIEWLARVSGTT